MCWRPCSIAVGVVAVVSLALSEPALAGKTCMVLKGKVAAVPFSERERCASPFDVCLRGSLTGELAGEYQLVVTRLIGTNVHAAPTMTFYTGTTVIRDKQGQGTMTAVDTGAVDFLESGRLTAISTIINGTGVYAKASGAINIVARQDLATGRLTGRYEAELCLP